VVSLTTTPSRIERIRPVLNSLLDQRSPADAIVLAVPWFSRREQVEYQVPAWLESSDAITVLRCDDWGPATKLLATIEHEGRKGRHATPILAVDDDVIYPPDLVATFRHWRRRFPDAALGYRGWSIPSSLRWEETRTLYATSTRAVRPVDVLTGCWGYLVEPRMFDGGVFDYLGWPASAFFVDDVWISGHLARRRVPRLLVPGRLPPLSTRIGRIGGLCFQQNRDGTKNNEVIRLFAEYWGCKAACDKLALVEDVTT
jgi:hypothetical protein